MRNHGRIADVSGAGIGDHVCWTYVDEAEFRRAGLVYLSGGIGTGQRLVYVSGRTPERMRADLTGFAPAAELLDSGGLQLLPLAEAYDLSAPVSPDESLARYAAATEQALADGYTGLRVLADVTDLIAEPARRPDHVRWEHLAEQYMAAHPLSALCGYDLGVVGVDGVGDVAAVHPLVHGPDDVAPFQLFFDDGRLALAGCVDAFSCDQLRRLLAASHVREGAVRIDVSDLDFVDARGMHALVQWGRDLADAGGRLTIEGASDVFRRAWQALRFDRVTGIELTGLAA